MQQSILNSKQNDVSFVNLSFYLDATDLRSYPGAGTTWTDKSGNGRHFTFSGSPTFTSGTPSYFTTTGPGATGPASNSLGINNTSGYSIYLICMQNALVATGAFQFYRTGTAPAHRAIFAHCTWSDDVVYFDQGGCCGTDTRTSVASGGSQTWNIWTFTRETNGNTRKIYKNGSLLATNTNAAATIDLNSTGVQVGSVTDYSGTWNARLGGFLAYNIGQTDAEVLSNANFLKSRYGIA